MDHPDEKGLMDWVSKTDVVRYARCPYAFWLIDRKEVAPEVMLGPSAQQLIEGGRNFEEMVTSGIPTLALTDENRDQIFASDIQLFGGLRFENEQLHLFGQPDGVSMAEGALIPIEVKSHRKAKKLDRLELAFYWKLLEPYRKRKRNPRGILYLPGEHGEPREVEVQLRAEDFSDLRRICKGIRRAREVGVKPHYCDCGVCSGRPEVAAILERREGITILYGIGEPRARALAKIGVRTLRHVEECPTDEMLVALKSARQPVGIVAIERWKAHARSYREARPVRLRHESLELSRFAVLDLEYDLIKGGMIWLIGCTIVDGDRHETTQLWADNEREEQENLATLQQVMEREKLPVVTWSGSTAEIPTLRKASARTGVPTWTIEDKHVDLYRYVERCFRFPTPYLSIKHLGEFFGIERIVDVGGGFEAQMLWMEYRKADEARRDVIRKELLSYNKDDLAALAGIARCLQDEAWIATVVD